MRLRPDHRGGVALHPGAMVAAEDRGGEHLVVGSTCM
jgi:hypothetical protein